MTSYGISEFYYVKSVILYFIEIAYLCITVIIMYFHFHSFVYLLHFDVVSVTSR